MRVMRRAARCGVGRGPAAHRGTGSPLRRAAPLLAASVLALSAAGCATRASGLGAPESPCFRSLPAASVAVQHRGRFAGVKYLTNRQLVTVLRTGGKAPASFLPPALEHSRDHVCVVAYRGLYGPAQVAHPWPPTVASASLALVVVDQDKSDVLDTVLLQKLPIGFARVFPALGRTPALR